MGLFTKIGNVLVSALSFGQKAADTVSSVADKAEEISKKVQEAVDKGQELLNGATVEFNKKISELSTNLEELGTISLMEIHKEEFDLLVKSAVVIPSEQLGKRKPVVTMYYDGPRMLAMKIRWPKNTIYFKANYKTRLLG